MFKDGTGMSGRNFDAFVSSQRTFHDDYDLAAKIQETYWRARQKFLAKIEKKEDSCIVLSDSKLDAKLEVFRSIDRSCAKLINLLENYQNNLFVYANEENSLAILLKECSKRDKTTAGKIMLLTGKGLSNTSHQRIKLYMPLMRLYQEMETFHTRAVDDSNETVDKLESKRTQYRASLLWMKDISERLNPDIYQQLDKFRRVQNQVRNDKKEFDKIQMDVVQKIDLLMASRCNLMNQVLGSYQETLLETFEKNYNNYRSLEELIKKEDIYNYEFKTLTQLNPLPITRSESRAESNEADDLDLMQILEADQESDSNKNSIEAKQINQDMLIDLLEAKSDDDDDDYFNDLLGGNSPLPADVFQQQQKQLPNSSKNDLLIDDGGAIAAKTKNSTNSLEGAGDLLNFDNEAEDDNSNFNKKPNSATNASKKTNNNSTDKDHQDGSGLIDLLKSDLDEIDNSSYFKTLGRLQL